MGKPGHLEFKGLPERRQWHPTPVLLPGKSHGRRSLIGCSPWGHKESDATERLHFLLCMEVKSESSLPGSSVHGIFQARVLEWVAISFSRGSPRPRDQTQVSCIAGRFFAIWATREARECIYMVKILFSFPLCIYLGVELLDSWWLRW